MEIMEFQNAAKMNPWAGLHRYYLVQLYIWIMCSKFNLDDLKSVEDTNYHQ